MSARHFGIPQTTARHSAGAMPNDARHHAPPEAGRNHSSFAVHTPFPRSNLAQAMIDVTAVVFAFLFVSVTALAIVGAVFIAFFVSV